MRHLFLTLILCFLIPLTIGAKKRPCGNGVYWELTETGTLIISGVGRMNDYSYDRVKTPWSSSRHKIKVIIIEEGVTYIGKDAFCLWKRKDGDNLPLVKEVRIPKSLKSIGIGAFLNTSVQKVFISDLSKWCNIKFDFVSNPCSHGARLYYVNGKEIRQLTIPAGITKIRPYTFIGCKSLISVDLNTVVSIGKDAFRGCSNLKSVVFSNATDTISSYAFYGCNLSALSIPLNVNYIGESVFAARDGNYSWDKNYSNEILCLPKWLSNRDKKEWEKCGLSDFSVKRYLSSVHNNKGEIVIASKYGRAIDKCTFSDNGVDYYVVKEDGKCGLINSAGSWIIPQSRDYSEIVPIKGYIRVKDQNFYGIFTLAGKEIIPTSRGYTSIGEYNSSKGTFAFTKKGYSGTCNAQGVEISATRLALSSDDVKTNGGYASAVAMNNGSTKYYKVSKGGRYGLTNAEGKVLVPVEMDALESAGAGYLRYKLNGFWGLMNYQGKVLIDTDRGYTSIGDFKSFNKRFAYTMVGYKGECDANGRQISKIKVDTPIQSTSVASSSSSSSTSSSSSNNSNSGNNTTTIHVEHHHDPVPVQQWVQCTSCWGSGNCRNCAGSGTTYIGSNLHRCSMCGGRGRCTTCSGQGGRYYTVYK